MAVCSVWVLGGGASGWVVKKIHALPPCPPNKRNPVPYLPKIYGKPCTWWQELNLELSFETQSSLKIILKL